MRVLHQWKGESFPLLMQFIGSRYLPQPLLELLIRDDTIFEFRDFGDFIMRVEVMRVDHSIEHQ